MIDRPWSTGPTRPDPKAALRRTRLQATVVRSTGAAWACAPAGRTGPATSTSSCSSGTSSSSTPWCTSSGPGRLPGLAPGDVCSRWRWHRHWPASWRSTRWTGSPGPRPRPRVWRVLRFLRLPPRGGRRPRLPVPPPGPGLRPRVRFGLGALGSGSFLVTDLGFRNFDGYVSGVLLGIRVLGLLGVFSGLGLRPLAARWRPGLPPQSGAPPPGPCGPPPPCGSPPLCAGASSGLGSGPLGLPAAARPLRLTTDLHLQS